MASETDTEARVLRVIERSQHLPEGRVTLDDSFEQLGIESLDAVHIIFALEDEFGIDLPEDAKEYRSVRDAVAGMRRLVEARAGTE